MLPNGFMLLLMTCFLAIPAAGLSQGRPGFLGLNPAITIEPYYARGEMDINVFPLVYQRPLSLLADLRMGSIVNFGIRDNGNRISHLGLELALPVFLRRKESATECSNGFFLAPVASFARNRIEQHYNLGAWIEPGYHLRFDNALALSFGLQAGGTYFSDDHDNSRWRSHFGIKIILGKWF